MYLCCSGLILSLARENILKQERAEFDAVFYYYYYYEFINRTYAATLTRLKYMGIIMNMQKEKWNALVLFQNQTGEKIFANCSYPRLISKSNGDWSRYSWLIIVREKICQKRWIKSRKCLKDFLKSVFSLSFFQILKDRLIGHRHGC